MLNQPGQDPHVIDDGESKLLNVNKKVVETAFLDWRPFTDLNHAHIAAAVDKVAGAGDERWRVPDSAIMGGEE